MLPLHDFLLFPCRRLLRSPRLAGALLAVAGSCFAAASASAQTTPVLTTLRSFNGVNGEDPQYALIAGADGNFYGTTTSGGTNNYGTVFRAAPDGALTLLHSFAYSTDGAYPKCTLLLAQDGNFYGTTSAGGPGNGGTVFQMTPDGTLTLLHTFSTASAAGGLMPTGGLIQGTDGSLYGTTSQGGTNNDGTLFRVAFDGTFTSLYAFNFHQTGAGPYDPESSLLQASDGNFYGVANGGDNAVGSVYRMTPGGVVTTIHSFSKTDGSSPVGPLVEGSPGVLYGMTSSGGGSSGNGVGTVFKVTTAGQLTTLHAFTNGGTDGNSPEAGLIRGTDGNFYGTTRNGGARFVGNIIQCTPDGAVTSLYSFNQNTSASGYYPYGALLQAGDGSFYGLADSGGASNYGVVYRLSFDTHPPFFDGETDLSNSVEYLQFPDGDYFGYYSFLNDPHYIFHFDLGYEYVFDAADGESGVYLYDFKSSDFFYTSPTFPFPYLYDFNLGTVLYYYPDPNNPGHYNTNGIRYFYDFATGKVIVK